MSERDLRRSKEFVTRYNPEKINGNFEHKHIVTVEQFNRNDLDILYTRAAEYRRATVEDPRSLLSIAAGCVSAQLFYEPSTRTDNSFQAAMHRLGGRVIGSSNGVHFSSVYKGENLADTIRAFGCYADVIILRHPEVGSSYEAAYYLDQLNGNITRKVSVISGGDGVGEHPTQALLDLFTIGDEKRRLNDLDVTLVGDLAHGRTVHSLSKLMALADVEGVNINLVSPQSLQMPREVTDFVTQRGISVIETENLNDVIGYTDVIYWTRVQEERFENDPAEYERVKDRFIMTPNVLALAKRDAILMHPLPRKHEMGTPEDHDILDADPRSVYFKQMENGMYVRMSLLAGVLGRA